jgi:DNA-binding MarR family transcriptional regulator
MLNEIIHQPVRMRIMAALVALQENGQMEFTLLRDVLSLTDGNLGAHLRKLEDAGYVSLEKTFVARKPRTFVATTKDGRQAFEAHVEALEQILSGAEVGEVSEE